MYSLHTFDIQDAAGEREAGDVAFHLGLPGLDRLPGLCPQNHLCCWLYGAHHLKAHGWRQLSHTHTQTHTHTHTNTHTQLDQTIPKSNDSFWLARRSDTDYTSAPASVPCSWWSRPDRTRCRSWAPPLTTPPLVLISSPPRRPGRTGSDLSLCSWCVGSGASAGGKAPQNVIVTVEGRWS